MTLDKVINKVYRVLEDVTPLDMDCGKLCNGECCKGDSTTGMILFPGEEDLYKENNDFKVINDNKGNKLLVCSGRCNRAMRPISCRIFPLVPIIFEGKLYIIDDPRASGVCPLLYDEIKLNKKFEKAVYKAGKLLLKNEFTSDFFYSLTDEVSDILSLREKLLK